MLKDFVIADAVAIQVQGKYIDLHNQFDLIEIRINLAGRAAQIEFAATEPGISPAKIVLRFTDVDWMQISPEALKYTGYIEELGYKEPMDNDHEWLLREEQASPRAHLFLRLPEDEFVRIHAKRAQAEVLSD